ncbi:lipoprotein [Photobacterium gaetbulicola]|uniref:Lipoprotein n=2 Tax=Photobacterium gaetbulicola TaxID=1295392 RepID=A0A0B9H4S0_9GAMM|nr:lipoprotein [Photobacterium gaetbulicola]
MSQVRVFKRRAWQYGWLIMCLFGLLGCSAAINDYQNTKPVFNLFNYFDGNVAAWGMLQDRSGKQTRRFTVDIKGTVVNNTLTLEEDFVFNDGEKQRRVWVITQLADGTYTGRADDVVGEATGVALGNTLHWQYVLRIPVDGTSYDITFNDWMHLQDEKHLFNTAKMTKWGFTVGTVTLFFAKQL